eukprot:937331-Pyramimonas_sp.AAC.1
MPALYRVWGRIRQGEARSWEQSNRREFLAHQAGRSILELVHKQHLQAESGAVQEQELHSASIMWDLTNYYEHANRDKLHRRALDTGFNGAVMAIILNQYQGQRMITMNNQTSHAGDPTKRIPAGCSFATYLAQMFCIEALDIWTSNVEAPLHMFIDDLPLFSH